MFTAISQKFESLFSSVPFDTLLYLVWGSYAAVTLAAILATAMSPRVKAACKRPHLCLTNAYAGVNLALFLLKYSVEKAVFWTAAFWVCGYILYGLLCLLSAKPRERSAPAPVPAMLSAIPPAPVPMTAQRQRQEIPAAKNNVRLEHASSVTDKLLLKNLSKGDRQELEKLKNTFAVLQIKGALSPVESDLLNDNFNTLLKLMAKYNV